VKSDEKHSSGLSGLGRFILLLVVVLGVGSLFLQKSESRTAIAIQRFEDVPVNYSLSIQDAVNAARIPQVNTMLMSDYFFRTGYDGTKNIDFELFYFAREISTEEVLQTLDSMNLRPVNVPELIASVAKYGEALLESKSVDTRIIALGTPGRNSEGMLCYPSFFSSVHSTFWADNVTPKIGLSKSNGQATGAWNTSTYFLATPK